MPMLLRKVIIVGCFIHERHYLDDKNYKSIFHKRKGNKLLHTMMGKRKLVYNNICPNKTPISLVVVVP